ncbi:hypothetical protein GUJ93_ZPchr0004g39589 [Zizania palustris]|uniref:Uncharacterized protein n=1 Tax=Zizania palustris TaxID=103762 RepID=A0A8J5VNW3_ZIZPA|nr:hypothetical protein GUJ93_ZPchr0004g39589 [Zizania palustris]
MGSAIVDLGSGSGLKAGARRSNLRSFLHIATPSLDAYTVAKVYELYQDFPPLTSLNSIELSPSSWMSIFWYPIGHVPMTTHKDLTTCFLTYHSLSTFEGSTPPDSKATLTLAPFGLATHNTDGDVWTSKDSGDQELVTSLVGATDSWLKKLGIKHHDFSYFLNNNKDLIHYRSITKESTSAGTGTDTATS